MCKPDKHVTKQTSMTHRRAQRLPSTSLPGELLKHTFDTTRKLKLKEVGERDPVYLGMIRKLPCIKCTLEPCGQAMHVRQQSAAHGKRGGIGKKPADKWTLPGCSQCHAEQHKIGELQFYYNIGISAPHVCTRLYAARGDLVKMRSIVFAARAGMLS
jgi:hypothetical protein